MKAARVFLWACVVAGSAEAARIHDVRPLMGTAVEIVAEGEDEAALRGAAEAAYREMNRLSDMMNHYDPRSVVSAINDAAGERRIAVPRELAEVLRSARRMSERSRGAFDVTVASLRGWRFRQHDPGMPRADEIARQLPLVNWRNLHLEGDTAFLARKGMRIDLGGIAKLHILEAGLRTVERSGVRRLLVNGGGDVLVRSNAAPWRVGVRDPRAPDRLLGAIELRRGVVATSGDYERYFERDGRRYHHILDPRTGYPSQGPHGVTLVAERVEAVNGLGVAIMVLGEKEGARLVEATPGLDALIVGRDGRVWMSQGMRARLKE